MCVRAPGGCGKVLRDARGTAAEIRAGIVCGEDVGKKSIEFLGFEFRWGKDQKGKPHLERRTSRKRYRRSLQRFTEWCKKTRHLKNKERFSKLSQKLTGYYNHYGLPDN